MKFKTYSEFITEKSTKPKLPPEVELRNQDSLIRDKINELNQKASEKPEQRPLIMAQIEVEKEKLDMIRVKLELLRAKEEDNKRKEREKAQKEREKILKQNQK